MIEPEDDRPADPKPAKEMTELEKYHAGEPFDSAKLWQAMDDDMMDKLTDGITEGLAAKKKREAEEAKARQDGDQPAE